MRAKLYTALSIAFLLATCSLANAEAAGGVVYKSAAEIQAETPSTAGGKNADGQILTLDRAQVLYGRTVKSAETAEMHTAIDVIYYVISGHADVIAGGKFEGGHKRPPENEDMVGGKNHRWQHLPPVAGRSAVDAGGHASPDNRTCR